MAVQMIMMMTVTTVIMAAVIMFAMIMTGVIMLALAVLLPIMAAIIFRRTCIRFFKTHRVVLLSMLGMANGLR